MDWSFWGVILGMVSIAVTLIGCAIGIARSWDSMMTKQAKTDNRALELVQHVTQLIDDLKVYMKNNEQFQTEVRKDIEQFKLHNHEQHVTCKENAESLKDMEQDLKIQATTQQFMKQLFEDVRSVQLKTTDALNALVNVIGKMETVLITFINGVR